MSKRALLFPRIKNGLQLIPVQEQIYLGHSGGGVFLPFDPYLKLLRSCTGRYEISQILTITNFERAYALYHLNQLSELGLLELLPEPAQIDLADESLKIFAHRHEIERRLITWRQLPAALFDGGFYELSVRAEFSILIHGDNRIAHLLFPLLLASGFTHVKLISPKNSSALIEATDINALSITAEHLAKRKSNHLGDLARNSILFQKEGLFPPAPDLIIASAPAPADYIQRWMSETSTHIQIGSSIAGEVEISHLITPGATPCLRCVQLHRVDVLPAGAAPLLTRLDSDNYSELPVSAAAYLAGFMATLIADLLVNHSSPLKENKSAVINLLEPTLPIRFHEWEFHPECGCQR